jgi:peptide/nickel transport system permease protein
MTLAGDNASDARIAEIRSIYGLDRPFLVQYGAWFAKAVTGNLSRSLMSGEDVTTAIARAYPNTLLIVGLALTAALALGIPLGIAAATKRDGVVDRIVDFFASLGVALPNFWLAMILVSIVALDWQLLPATGAVPLSVSPLDALRHAILPALAIAAGSAAEIARQLRSAMLDALSSQYVRTLRARGVPEYSILWQHAFRNVAITMLTVVSLVVNRMLAATVVVEAVFAIPGMGSLIVHAAISRDFPVVHPDVCARLTVWIGCRPTYLTGKSWRVHFSSRHQSRMMPARSISSDRVF